MVKPSGWHTVRYDDLVDGKYLYNRCHLIGYQLTGENANTKNLITGTRYLNIEGMLPFENMVADYVKENGNHVMYRVTPIFEGDNLLARVELAEEAKVEDYSLLLISMPKIEQDTEFTPDRLQSALQDNDRTEWVFSRLEEQWKQKYYAVAVSPPEHGTGNLCPISFGKYKGKYSARWIDCAHCHFNVAQPPCCLCVAGAGIQKKEDFKRDLQDRLFDIDKIRRTNEEEIRLREVRERSFERRSVYPRPTPYAARPVVPAGPTQEDLDAEYIRICQSYDPTSDEWTVDRYNRRWIMCTVCGRIKQDAQMSYYGGKGGANRGVCADCSRNGRS